MQSVSDKALHLRGTGVPWPASAEEGGARNDKGGAGVRHTHDSLLKAGQFGASLSDKFNLYTPFL